MHVTYLHVQSYVQISIPEVFKEMCIWLSDCSDSSDYQLNNNLMGPCQYSVAST